MSREPELTYSQSGVAICRVGLACSEKYGEKETQLFIDGTAFKKTGEMLATVKKGHRVLVTGKLETQQWQDQQSGKNRSKICMLIESFEFIEPKQDNQQQPNQNGFQQPQQQNQGFQQNNSGFQQKQGQPNDDIPW
jgi:single-strand DNA-binding protein